MEPTPFWISTRQSTTSKWLFEIRYFESATNATTIEEAAAYGSLCEEFVGADINIIFMYNESQDQGYLVMDTDQNGSFESGIILAGCGQSWDFGYDNLLPDYNLLP